MRTKYMIAFLAACLMLCCVGFAFCAKKKCPDVKHEEPGLDLKPVIYLYPEEDGTEVEVSLDYDGNLNELIPEFSSENKWEVVADKDGTITYDGQTYEYLFWEGDPNYEYDFFSGFCVKGSDTESFLNDKLHEMGLNDAETAEFIEFWLPRMEGNEYNVISFQGDTYKKGAKLSVSPQPDNLIRVFMAWYPSDKYVKINPQSIQEGSRDGFTVVEWGGNKVR
ncbi:hypothetical protein D6853_10495 [Butyrivibrio sp. X503]|uniref:hypothetical protein n=1 Tax=Butyrivibrio sp. X503 TaxID=2364878 RepID=UPI000EA88FE5|nr:hypothetical protein [Butyrivibrio sp. X503]RKM55155.1 hypothetical protein D6853_10495 [Butyrivibrio sp. X503]